MSRVIAVSSGKARTGKSTVVAAVSSCLAALGYKTLCMGFGAAKQSLEFSLGLSDIKYTGYIDVRDRQGGIIDECSEHPEIPGLFYLLKPIFFDIGMVDITEVMPLFNEIRETFDFCVVDTQTVYNDDFSLTHAVSDISIIVTTGELIETSDILRVAGVALDAGVNDLRLIVNRIFQKNEGIKEFKEAIEDVISELGVQLIGLIPEDRLISEALQSSVPLILYHEHNSAYHMLDIAHSLTGKIRTFRMRMGFDYAQPCHPVERREPESHDSHSEAVDETPESEQKYKYALLNSDTDRELWAMPTLSASGIEGLVKVFEVGVGAYAHKETIRNRIWVHDYFDDNGIMYYIQMEGRLQQKTKHFIEVQSIYVMPEDVEKARFLVRKFHDAGFADRDDLVKELEEQSMVDGVPQKMCPVCGEEIDFDYHKCPHCKASDL